MRDGHTSRDSRWMLVVVVGVLPGTSTTGSTYDVCGVEMVQVQQF